MSNKTYHQYCAIAHALDIVGERWTLLIVRNLLLGPKRFSDLMKGLPGISTNILTERLKSLEEHQLITTQFLPPPAASTVYLLTQDGFGLAGVLTALARWGSQTLGTAKAGQFMVPEAIGFMVMGVFHRLEPVTTITLTCNVDVQHALYTHIFGVHLSPQGVMLKDTPLPTADVTMHLGLDTLSTLSSLGERLATFIQDQAVRVDGTPAAVEQLITWVDTR